MAKYSFNKFSAELLNHASANRRTALREIVENERIADGQYYILENGEIENDLTSYFDSLVSPRTSKEKTWNSYADQLKIFFNFLDAIGMNWKDVTSDILHQFYKVRRLNLTDKNKTISKNTWNLSLAAIDSLYRWAVLENIITRNPVEKEKRGQFEVNKLSEKKETLRLINFIDINVYRNSFIPLLSKNKKRNYFRNIALCDLLLNTGMRLGSEALKLEKDTFDLIDLEGKTYSGKKFIKLRIVGKGGKTRFIKIHRRIVKEIKDYIIYERDVITKNKSYSHKELFLSERGTPLCAASIEAMFRDICKASDGDISLTPHGLRHTFAIYQLEAMIKKIVKNTRNTEHNHLYKMMMGDPLRLLQKMLGHSHLSTTFIYLDFIDENEAFIEETLETWISDWSD